MKTTTALSQLGALTLCYLAAIGRAGIMLALCLFTWPQKPLTALRLWLRQVYAAGVLSLVIIVISGGFIGMVLALQSYAILVNFGSEDVVGQLVALTLLRELSPVVAALLFAGRAGSAITAEIALMQASEQIASMEMMGVDPLRRIVAVRLWAGIFSLPLLSAIFSSVGIISGAWVAVDWLGVYSGSYWGGISANVEFGNDVVNGLIKALVFALLVSWVAVYQGFHCLPTSEGISKATTRTVVHSSLLILGFDFILTAWMFGNF